MRPTKYEAQTARRDDMASKTSPLERPSFDDSIRSPRAAGDARRQRWQLGLVSTALLSLASVGFVAPSNASASSDQVTITRDSDGVAHITAANFTALGYGEAWAFSQDSFCTLAQDFVTLEARRSLYFGPTPPTSTTARAATTRTLIRTCTGRR